MILRKLLAHPLTRNMDVDNLQTTFLHQQIIQEKPLLHSIYQQWYRIVLDNLPMGSGPILELGTGVGFLKQIYSALITSDIIWLPSNILSLDGQQLPFASASL